MKQVELLRTVGALRERLSEWRAGHETVALVPTMGNLHRGHMSLASLASERAQRVVMTIFVNPTQFGVGEDFADYPRTLDDDLALIGSSDAVDALFLPEIDEIYPQGPDAAFRVKVPDLGNDLCGQMRPGHFDGVATVVLRLLNIVMPDLLVLGRKDYQQLVIIERMIADLRLPVAVVAGDTMRDEDGLAISSRNRYLTAEERRVAPLLHATLARVRDQLAAGERDHEVLTAEAMQVLRDAGFRPDYVEVRRASDLTKPNGRAAADELVVLGAAWLGRARLIDNLIVRA